ncbi:MAG: DUF4190 domain-containing protein [Lentisphaeria bacterium]|nr:DUF4190 domain-containing protein [Lentisphaeria bacterium]
MEPTSQPPVPPPAPKTSGLAVTSLVLGVVSVLMCMGPLAGIPAVICGHIALSKISRSRGTQTGKGLAIGGLAAGYVGIFLVTLFFLSQLAIFLPALNQARTRAMEVKSMSNLKQVGMALAMYTDAGSTAMPASLDGLVAAGLLSEDALQSPFFDDAEYDYILLYPAQMAPADTPLVIEKAGGRGRRIFLWSDMNYVDTFESLKEVIDEDTYQKLLER